MDEETPARPAPTSPQIPELPPPASRYLRYLLAFGVGSMIALAPYLGLLDVPGFRALLDLIPLDLRDIVLPMSGAVAGLLAVVVQWYGRDHLSRAWLRRAFLVSLACAVVTLVIFVNRHFRYVVAVTYGGGEEKTSFTVGPGPRQAQCGCPANVSDASCIKQLTLNPARVRDCWGDRSVSIGQQALLWSYCAFLGAFGALVGVVFLRDEILRTSRRSGGKAKRGGLARAPSG